MIGVTGMAMGNGTFLIGQRVFSATGPGLEEALHAAYNANRRPRCLCVPGGIEMYIAKHRHFVIKRMPGTGPQHHPTCDSFEPEASCSGRGTMMGGAIVPTGETTFDLHVDFPLARAAGRTPPTSPSQPKVDVRAAAQRMSLHALLQFLFEQAGFNRWAPGMAGRRHQGVIRKFLLEAASETRVKGRLLIDRLYVPEAFDEAAKQEIAARRRARLAVLRPTEEGRYEMAIVIGEFKDATESSGAMRIRVRHMADAPLTMDVKGWQRLQRKFSWMFDLAASEVGDQVRILMCMLIYAKQEHVLHIDTATCMLTSRNWIPLDAAFEVDVAAKLTAEDRRFLKPLRYDAGPHDAFANFLLLDTGAAATPLHILSGFMSKEACKAKARVIEEAGEAAWVWRTNESMPPLPARVVHHAGT